MSAETVHAFDRPIRKLRAKAAQLETAAAQHPVGMNDVAVLQADVALIAGILADVLEAMRRAEP